MRAVVQRVLAARVEVKGEVVGAIDRGLVVFLGAATGDTPNDVSYLVDKIIGLRVFEDETGKMGRSVAEVEGGLLIISQFTVYADLSRGRRPSFDRAMPPDEAQVLYDAFVSIAHERHPLVASGRFRADMKVVVENDGPVTLIVESPGSRSAETTTTF